MIDKLPAWLRDQFPPDKPHLVGVSGGLDSLVLLDVLRTIGYHNLIVCHLNHGLRGRESGGDAAHVRRAAGALGLPCEVEKVPVTDRAAISGLSIETCAREERWLFFGRMSQKWGCRTVFLAHHRDDQAETILARLCRGTGVRGLGGMRLRQEIRTAQGTDLELVRPFLEIPREALREWASGKGLKWREDKTNAEPIATRNRIRNEALPLLEEIFGRDPRPALARLATLAAAESNWMESLAREALQLARDESGALRVKRVAPLPDAAQRQVLRLWLEDTGLPGVEQADVEAVRSLLTFAPGSGGRINLPKNKHCRRKAGRLWIE